MTAHIRHNYPRGKCHKQNVETGRRKKKQKQTLKIVSRTRTQQETYTNALTRHQNTFVTGCIICSALTSTSLSWHIQCSASARACWKLTPSWSLTNRWMTWHKNGECRLSTKWSLSMSMLTVPALASLTFILSIKTSWAYSAQFHRFFASGCEMMIAVQKLRKAPLVAEGVLNDVKDFYGCICLTCWMAQNFPSGTTS